METKCITTLDELSDIARIVLDTCAKKNTTTVFCLVGDLGAGKTAFTKEIAKHLGIIHEVTSPTFVIMKSYPILSHPFFKTLSHIDAYRIESEDEMRVLGFTDMLNNSAQLICIEWPEKIPSLIPSDAYIVSITLNNDGTREVHYGT
jgi:tRNA threonylcarbamoyladenosine biosynthesis protein TsaE